MFDKKSLDALNKLNPDAIVCSDVSGDYVHITRTDFTTEEEFLFWKTWSDNEYHEAERTGRSYYDNNVPLNEDLNVAGESLENDMISAIDQASYDRKRAEQLEKVKDILTETQFRRLWKYHVKGMTEQEIADAEGVGQQRISNSIIGAHKKIKKFLVCYKKRGVKTADFLCLVKGLISNLLQRTL